MKRYHIIIGVDSCLDGHGLIKRATARIHFATSLCVGPFVRAGPTQVQGMQCSGAALCWLVIAPP
jgi:hypothetical protein